MQRYRNLQSIAINGLYATPKALQALMKRPTLPMLLEILDLGHPDGLPLHIRGRVRAAGTQGDDVILDPTRTSATGQASSGAGIGPLELGFDGGVTLRPKGAQGEADEQRDTKTNFHFFHKK